MTDESRFGKGKTNKEIREWYLKEVARISELNEEWKKQRLPAIERAQKAWQIRHEARLTARSMMSNPIEVKLLQERDMDKYGYPDGPTFIFLVEECKKIGLEGDEIYEAIINESYKTNVGVNKKMGLQ